jgi:serine/threonine-protein kinase
MSTCSKCGTKYPDTVRFCTRDGTVLEHDTPSEESQIGKVLAGKYRLDAHLSRGGMGSVYRATHLMLEKPVALKVIKPELVGSSEFARRFQREARAATSLNHPNIVAVYDLGQAEDGTLYIAMELVDGPSLKDAIQKGGPMDPIRIVRLMRQVLSALALAHRHTSCTAI